MTTQTHVTFTDLRGCPRTWTICPDGHVDTVADSVISRVVRTGDGREAVLRWVPAATAAADADSCDPLENEARVAHRLVDLFADGHPPELLAVLGHDLDGVEPSLLTERPRGEPVVDIAGRLGVDEEHEFERSLFRALQCLADAGVVHGGLSPLTVRWDRETATVQLTDFSRAAVVGERVPVRPAPAVPGWVNPPVGRVAAHADDMWAAGLLVLHAVTGRGDPADLDARGPALRSLLDGVFNPSPAARPAASVLLRRLSAAPHALAPPTESAEQFELGRARFDEELRAKFAPLPAGSTVRASGPVAHRLSRLVLALTVCVAIVAVAFVVIAL